MSAEAAVPAPRENFTVVQALRGIAALWVVLFHASEGGHIDLLKASLPRLVDVVVFDSGHYGVAIFFALSGFVIAHSLRGVVPTWEFLGRFVARRSIRLDPAYWASMIVVIVLAWLSACVKHEPVMWPSPQTIAAHIVYLQVILAVPSINVVYWTLTYEVQFYVFLAVTLVIAKAISRRPGGGWAWPVAWSVMTLLAFGSALSCWDGLPSGLFPGFWAAFFVGVLAYLAAKSRSALAAFVVLAILMGWAPKAIDPAFFRLSALTAVCLALALHTGYIFKGLAMPWVQFLGSISYSLYLLHNPLTGATGFLVKRALGDSVITSSIVLISTLIVSIAGATIFWRLIELPSHRLSRRVRLPRNAA